MPLKHLEYAAWAQETRRQVVEVATSLQAHAGMDGTSGGAALAASALVPLMSTLALCRPHCAVLSTSGTDVGQHSAGVYGRQI